MRIVRHSNHIKQQKRKSKWLAFIGFLVLTSAMFLAMLPNALLFAYVAMIGGFVMFNIGMQGIGRWTRNPRNDQILDVRMKGLSDQVTLVHYASITDAKDKKKVVDHLVIYGGGVLVLNAKEIDGKIQQNKSTWRKQGGLIRKMFSFSGPQLGNPSFENDRLVPVVEQWLADNQLEVDVMAVTVFLHPRTELEIEEPDYPVLHAEEIPEFMREIETDESFSQDEKFRLIEMLSAGDGVETPEMERATRRPRPVRRKSAPRASQVKRKSA